MKTYALLFAMLVPLSLFADPLADMKKLGEGEMRFLFWTLYKAELYSASDRYQENVKPIALKITYLRDIDSEDLVEATKDQWDHIELQSEKQQQWLERLKQIWPDIKEGDVLTFKVQYDGTGTFYFSNNPIGTIEDSEFGIAFLSIWLSDKTSRPKLRVKLIGEI